MSSNLNTTTGIIVVFVALPLAVLWLNDRLARARVRRQNPPAQRAAEREAFRQRLLRPDWEFYQRHLQRPVPPALRELYADPALLAAKSLAYTEGDRISSFNPLTPEDLVEAKSWLGFDLVPIATSDFGDSIYLRPGSAEPDVVYITYHDGGETEVFAESVAAMLKQLRQANPAAGSPR